MFSLSITDPLDRSHILSYQSLYVFSLLFSPLQIFIRLKSWNNSSNRDIHYYAFFVKVSYFLSCFIENSLYLQRLQIGGILENFLIYQTDCIVIECSVKQNVSDLDKTKLKNKLTKQLVEINWQKHHLSIWSVCY